MGGGDGGVSSHYQYAPVPTRSSRLFVRRGRPIFQAMPKLIRRHASDHTGSAGDRLARLLDTASLERVVPQLPPETLHRLVRHRGLEACGDLVTSATPAQLVALLDLDLWRPARPGADERFDVERFGEWVEVLVESGPETAARTVATLDESLVVAGLSRYVRVFDPGIFEPVAESDDEAPDRADAMREGDRLDGDVPQDGAADEPPPDASDTGLECELGGYVLRARRADAWDAIVALLAELDAGHGRSFHALMRGCRRLSHSRPEVDGLDELLPAPEQHLHEVATSREHRRSRRGYATPAEARAFLRMARQTASTRTNPIVAAWFRAAHDPPEAPARGLLTPAEREASDLSASIVAAALSLDVDGSGLLRLPGPADAAAQDARLSHLRSFLERTGEAASLERGRELAFLANVLVAACTLQSRPFTPAEAAEAAAATCNLGLETLASVPPDLVAAFEAGWSVLHLDVSVFVAERLASTLHGLRRVDRDLRPGLAALVRALEAHAEAPWLVRDTLDVLALLDQTAWLGVCGLLGECPVLPAAVTAVLDGRTTAVCAADRAFIATAAQVEDVRAFVRTLPELLAG